MRKAENSVSENEAVFGGSVFLVIIAFTSDFVRSVPLFLW